MKFIGGRVALVFSACALALAGCSSGSTPATFALPREAAPSEVAQSVLHASSYVRLMADTVSVNNVGGFALTSTTFTNNGIIPKIMIGGPPQSCGGGNRSPALFWSHPPAGTKSFALVVFDETANFGHWGIYNLRPNANRLPEDVKPGTIAGLWMQADNDLILSGILDQGYAGPCPPPGLTHHYMFTIYALDTMLALPSNPGLVPPTIESLLYHMTGHVIGRASISGFLAEK